MTVPASEIPAANFSWRRVARLARKELREILRDRRTVVTLIAMPLLLYPLMSVAFQQFYLANAFTSEVGQDYRIGAMSSAEFVTFQHRVKAGEKIRDGKRKPLADAAETKAQAGRVPELVWPYPSHKTHTAAERAAMLEELKQALREGKIDVIIEIPDMPPETQFVDDPPRDEFFRYEAYYMPNSPVAREALAYFDAMFAYVNAKDLHDRLNRSDVKPHVAMVSMVRVPLEKASNEGMISLAALVPLILILMTITGAVYPAIDLTAGERERGTLEILIAAPVARFELLFAKYLSVVTVAVLNALVNLFCMAITLTWSGLAPVLFHEGNMSPVLLLQVFALLLLFAAFFSAVLLCLTSFARSFKEAQAYLIPLMLASLTPGIMAMMPGLKLQGILAVLPLVNIVLLARDLFNGELDAAIAGLVIFTTLLYALAALSLAAKVFGAESVLYSEQSSWGDLLRRPEMPQAVASIPAVLWCLGLMVPIQFSLLALFRSLIAEGGIPPVAILFLGVLLNLVLFGLLPAFFLWLGRVEVRSGLGLYAPRWGAVAAGLLLGFSVWPLELYLLAQKGDMTSVLEERYGAVLSSMKAARESIGWGVLVLVVVPAVLEEFFFRGMLLNALKRVSNAWVTIGTSGLLFGLSHVVFDSALGLERMLPSLLLGLILGAVCWRAGSLWPSMIQHVCHNAILLGVALYAPGSTHAIPWEWLAGGAAGMMASGFLLWRFGAPIEMPAHAPRPEAVGQ